MLCPCPAVSWAFPVGLSRPGVGRTLRPTALVRQPLVVYFLGPLGCGPVAARNHMGSFPPNQNFLSLFPLLRPGISVPFSPTLSPCGSLCKKEAGGRAAGLPLALSSLGDLWPLLPRQTLSVPCTTGRQPLALPGVASSTSVRHSIHPSLCALSLPHAPGDLSTEEEGHSEGCVQRPWTEEDKWNLQ